jgi:hypothetical protein
VRRKLIITLAFVLAIAAFALPAITLAEDPPPVPEPTPTLAPAAATCECPRQGFGYQKPEDSFLCRLWADELNITHWYEMSELMSENAQSRNAITRRINDMSQKNWYKRDISACPAELWK